MVGRNLMKHILGSLIGVSSFKANPTKFQKTLSLFDYYWGDADFPYPMGQVQMLGKVDRESLEGSESIYAPLDIEFVAKHSLDWWLTSEDLPDPNNRVALDGQGNIVLRYAPNNEQGHTRLIAKLKKLLSAQRKCAVHGHECHQGLFARNLYLGQRIPLAGVAHQNGTIRFGTDPTHTALDTNCKAHDLDNLYVVDGSFFPSSAAVNPALTIIANALRVGDHLLDRMRVTRTHRREELTCAATV